MIEPSYKHIKPIIDRRPTRTDALPHGEDGRPDGGHGVLRLARTPAQARAEAVVEAGDEGEEDECLQAAQHLFFWGVGVEGAFA